MKKTRSYVFSRTNSIKDMKVAVKDARSCIGHKVSIAMHDEAKGEYFPIIYTTNGKYRFTLLFRLFLKNNLHNLININDDHEYLFRKWHCSGLHRVNK